MNRLPQQDIFVFSQVGFGFQPGLGELDTRLIFISADTQSSGRGRLFFFRSDGSDLPCPFEKFNDSRFTYEIKSGGEIIFTPGIEFAIAAILVDPANLVVNDGNTTSLDPVTLDRELEDQRIGRIRQRVGDAQAEHDSSDVRPGLHAQRARSKGEYTDVQSRGLAAGARSSPNRSTSASRWALNAMSAGIAGGAKKESSLASSPALSSPPSIPMRYKIRTAA